MRHKLIATASLLALVIAPGASAQPEPAPEVEPEHPSEPTPTALEAQTVISGDELRRVPNESLEQALRGRLALASFGPDSAPGEGVLQLRGLPSLQGGASPLYVVDGVTPFYRVADLNTYDIERIEIFTGPAATALHGLRGAGGVIVITTRRGRSGPLQVQLSQRVGFSQLARKLGSRTFGSLEEATEAFGARARDFYQAGQVFDHEQQLASQSGPSVETLLQLDGGSEHTRFFVSGLFKNDTGLLARTGSGKQGLKLGLDQQVSSAIRLSATAHLLHSNARRGRSPYQLLAATPGFLDLSTREDGTFPSNPFLSSQLNPLEFATRYAREEDAWRVLGTLQMDAALWSAGPHTLTLTAQGGVDHFQRKDDDFLPPDMAGASTVLLGLDSQFNNLDGRLELRYQLRPDSPGLALQASAGVRLDEQRLDMLGTQTPLSAAGEPESGPPRGLLQQQSLTNGRAAFLHASGQLLGERLLLDAMVRAEQRNGPLTTAQDTWLHPMAAVAWRLLAPMGPIDEVRPRLVYGDRWNVGEAPATGTPRPERLRQWELGVDVLALGGTARLGMRAWQQQIDGLLLQTAPPSTGLVNGGRTLGRGVDAVLEAVPLQGERLRWTSRTLFGLSRTRVESLPVGPFIAGGFGTSLGVSRVEEGASLTQIFGQDGLRPDGTCCELRTLGDTAPDFRMSFQNEVRLGGLSLWVLLDWQRGGDAVNLPRFLQDAGKNSPDYATAGQERQRRFMTTARAYLEDTSFLKVREVALGYELPERWFRGVLPLVRQVRLSASARNVLTLSGYSGLDPELGAREDLEPLPPSRSFWGSLDVGF